MITPSGQDLFSLNDRVSVVSGASSGIGRALAGFLARAGAAVVLVARRKAVLQTIAEEIKTEGGRVRWVTVDLALKSKLGDVAAECLQTFGKVDIVVNAAAINLRQPVDEVTPESWNLTLDLNLAAPFFFTREFTPGVREKGYGRIINLASLQSSRAFADGLAYGASKSDARILDDRGAPRWRGHAHRTHGQ